MADEHEQPKEAPKQPGAYKVPESAMEKAAKAAAEKQAAHDAKGKHARRGQSEKIEPKRMGFDPLRPVRYGLAFAGGTVVGLFDGIAKGGRTGMWTGVAVGALCAISGMGLGMLLVGGFYGFLSGIGIGGALGLLTGGVRGVGRSYRKEKYADDLAAKPVGRSEHGDRGRPAPRINHHAAYDYIRKAAHYNFDRMMQQDNENMEDTHRYWQERIEGHDHSAHAWDKGGL